MHSLVAGIIAVTLIGGFAWLTWQDLQQPDPAPLEHTSKWQPPVIKKEVPVAIPIVAKASPSLNSEPKKPVRPLKPTDSEEPFDSYEVLDELRDTRQQEIYEQEAHEVELPDDADERDDLTEDERFQQLLNTVRAKEGFSKRFEVDIIETLRRRGYNPDGTPLDGENR